MNYILYAICYCSIQTIKPFFLISILMFLAKKCIFSSQIHQLTLDLWRKLYVFFVYTLYKFIKVKIFLVKHELYTICYMLLFNPNKKTFFLMSILMFLAKKCIFSSQIHQLTLDLWLKLYVFFVYTLYKFIKVKIFLIKHELYAVCNMLLFNRNKKNLFFIVENEYNHIFSKKMYIFLLDPLNLNGSLLFSMLDLLKSLKNSKKVEMHKKT